jgi:hypothetical protein
MSHLRNALLAGAAVIILGGAAGIAEAQTPASAGPVHVINVQMPDGSVQHIRYHGDVPPRIVLVPVGQPVMPMAQSMESPFTMMQRISAEMDRQMAMMMQVFSPMMAQPFGSAPITAAFGNMPAGSGVCMRSISVTYAGNGQKPQVVSRTSGDCGPAAPASTVNAPVVAPERTAPVPTIQVKDEHPAGQPAYRAMVVPAAYHRG